MGLFSRKPNIQKLQSQGKVSELVEILRESRYSSFHNAAAQALASINTTESVNQLIQLASKLNFAAIDALVMIGHPRIVPILDGILNGNNSSYVKEIVISQLLQINSKSSVESFLVWLNKQSNIDQISAITSLIQYGADPRIMNALILILNGNNPAIQQMAQIAFLQIGAPAVDYLLNAFTTYNLKPAARTLAKMYIDGKLDSAANRKIVQAGNIISEEHDDRAGSHTDHSPSHQDRTESHHYDKDCGTFGRRNENSKQHIDRSIGNRVNATSHVDRIVYRDLTI